jgi:hypothetical protein
VSQFRAASGSDGDRNVAMMPEQRSLWGRNGAYSLHAKYDPRATTEPARKAFPARFEREVDPMAAFPLAERVRRAQYARRRIRQIGPGPTARAATPIRGNRR